MKKKNTQLTRTMRQKVGTNQIFLLQVLEDNLIAAQTRQIQIRQLTVDVNGVSIFGFFD